MLARTLKPKVEEMLSKYPIVSITGPRQSGKTTLTQLVRPDYQYVSLEDPSIRLFAQQDPVGFLETYQNGVILDEVQYVPELFSYLQVITDARQRVGEYILTGSQNFLLMEKITQSLAGRVAVFNLLPFSLEELDGTPYLAATWEDQILQGFYPRKLVRDINSEDFYASYLQTYVERDVRQVKNILNLDLFQRFIRLLAGRIGQLFNQNSLATELGVDNKTISAWLSVLETSFVAYRLPPYFENFNKRLVKTPKVYFYDTGLAAYLLGIRSKEELDIHFAKGALFENLLITDMLKKSLNRGKRPDFYFWRDASQHEVDLLMQQGTTLIAVEIKSGKTIQLDYFKGLKYLQNIKPAIQSWVLFGGEGLQKRQDATVYGYQQYINLQIN